MISILTGASVSLNMFKPNAKTQPKIIGIAAGKGGVGKSTLTVNLALALIKKGLRVGLLDADLYGPSVRRMLPEDRLPKQEGELLIPAWSRGIRVLSMAYFRQENQATAVRAPIANGMIKKFLQQVSWGPLDYLLIDFPPGTGDIQITLSQQALLTGALMITTPQEISAMDVRKAIHLFQQLNVPLLGVVENMSHYEIAGERLYPFGKGGGARLGAEFALPLLAQIPLDPAISVSGDTGSSLFEEGPQHLQDIFTSLANQLEERCSLLQQPDRLGQFEMNWKEIP
jgi:ATP-binding protein involved in chromosome partitioning